MSKENVKRFYEQISTDEELRAKLEEISRKYQGDKIDEDRAALLLEKEILPLVDQLGFPFTVAELKEYEKEMQQSNADRALDDRELDTATGGGYGGWSFASLHLMLQTEQPPPPTTVAADSTHIGFFKLPRIF